MADGLKQSMSHRAQGVILDTDYESVHQNNPSSVCQILSLQTNAANRRKSFILWAYSELINIHN